MTLLEECKALAKGDYVRGWIDPVDLVVILNRHEHDDWKGPWKCEKCGRLWPKTIQFVRQGCGIEQCGGRLFPYERREGERRKA